MAVPSGDPDEWTGSAVGSCISVKFLPDRHFLLWTGRAASRATAYRYPPWNPNNNSTPLEEVRTAPLTFSAARVNRPDGSDGAPSRTLLPVHESGIPGICGLHMPLPRSERERGKWVPRLKVLRDGERKGAVVLVASAAELVPYFLRAIAEFAPLSVVIFGVDLFRGIGLRLVDLVLIGFTSEVVDDLLLVALHWFFSLSWCPAALKESCWQESHLSADAGCR